MKSAILYASFKRPKATQGSEVRRIWVDGASMFIRSAVIDGAGDAVALNYAKPRKGEILLNSIELPE